MLDLSHQDPELASSDDAWFSRLSADLRAWEVEGPGLLCAKWVGGGFSFGGKGF